MVTQTKIENAEQLLNQIEAALEFSGESKWESRVAHLFRQEFMPRLRINRFFTYLRQLEKEGKLEMFVDNYFDESSRQGVKLTFFRLIPEKEKATQ